jgi:hypothetical protein
MSENSSHYSFLEAVCDNMLLNYVFRHRILHTSIKTECVKRRVTRENLTYIEHLVVIVKTVIILSTLTLQAIFLKVFCNCVPDNGHVGRNMLYSILNNWNIEFRSTVFVLFQYMFVTATCISKAYLCHSFTL